MSEYFTWAAILLALGGIAVGIFAALGDAFWNSISSDGAALLGLVVGLLCIVGSHLIHGWLYR